MTTTNCVARRSVTFASAELADVDGLLGATASDDAPVELGPADFSGAAVNDGGASWVKLPRTITVSRSSSAGSYSTDPIVLTGRRGGATVTEELTPADADGDDVLRGSQLFDAPPTIAIPAQVDASGSFQFGVGDIGTPSGDMTVGVKAHTAGTVHLEYIGGQVDALVAAAHLREDVAAAKVLTGPSQTTGIAVTVYL